MKKRILISLVVGIVLLLGTGLGGYYIYLRHQALSLYEKAEKACQQKDYPQAFELCRKIIPEKLSMLPPLEQANTLINAGNCLYEMEKYADAIPYFAQAAEIVEKYTLLPQIATPAQLYSHWGYSYNTIKNYSMAEKIYSDGIDKLPKYLSKSYSGIALLHADLGKLYLQEANYPGSLTHLEMALNNEAFIKHQEVSDLAGFYGDIAAAYCHNNRLPEALHFYEKSIIYTKQTYGNDSARIGVEYAGKALVLFRQGKTVEAIKLLDLAYSILENKCGKNYRATRRISELRDEWQTKLNDN